MLGHYSSHVSECNMDDWWIATQTIIWEFTDGYRKRLSSIPENLGQTQNGKVVLGTVNPSGGEGYDFHYNVLRGRPARYIYFAMLRAMKQHRVIPSFSSKEKERAKTIYMEQVETKSGGTMWKAVNSAYRKKMTAAERAAAREKADYYLLKDSNACRRDLKVVRTKDGEDTVLREYRFGQSKNGYQLSYTGKSLPSSALHGKKNIPEAVKKYRMTEMKRRERNLICLPFPSIPKRGTITEDGTMMEKARIRGWATLPLTAKFLSIWMGC